MRFTSCGPQLAKNLQDAGRIDVVTPKEEVTVTADQRLCRQIIFNLTSNALKFSPPSTKVTVSVSLDDVTNEAVVEVADRGPGIHEDEVEHAMEAFVQLNSGTSDVRKQGGIGLGLFLVRSFMEAHGGQVNIISKPVEGTRVQAIFPASRVASPSLVS